MSKVRRISKRELIIKIKEETEAIEVKDLTSDIINNVNFVTQEDKKRKSFMLPKFIGPLAIALILIISLVIFIKPTPTPPVTEVSKAHQVYGIQAVTLFNFVDNSVAEGLNARKLLSSIVLDNKDMDYQKIAEEINDYLLSAADILKKDSVEYKEEKSDDPNYQVKMTMKIKMYNREKTYTLYFNETSDMEYNDIDEVSSKIEGIIETDTDVFLFDGKKEIEDSEYEVTLRMYLSVDKKAYYEVSQEIENHENEFSYGYYQNNRLVEEMEISVEELNNKKYVEMEVFKEGREIELEFNYYDNYILVEYEIDGTEGKVKAIPSEQTTIYQFENKVIEIFK